jgi:hypothetical protein
MADNLIPVATFRTVAEAALVRSMLEAEGIPALLDGEESAAMLGPLTGSREGVRLLVAEEHQERAAAILNAPAEDGAARSDEPLLFRQGSGKRRDDDEESPTAVGDALARRAWQTAVLGLFVCPPLLSLYSGWLLLKLAWSTHELSDVGRRKVLPAVVLDALVFFLAAAIASRTFGD